MHVDLSTYQPPILLYKQQINNEESNFINYVRGALYMFFLYCYKCHVKENLSFMR